MIDAPETHYVKSDGIHIAYQVLGSGPLDVVFVPGFVSNVETNWASPRRAHFFRRLTSFSRLILFDKRGTGMSDRSSEVFTLEQRMHDLQAILDAVGSKRAVLFGLSEGGPMSILFAATYPARTEALVLYGAYAKRSWASDYPLGWRDEQWESVFQDIEKNWGTPRAEILRMWAPSIAQDAEATSGYAAYLRSAASPGAALAVMKMNRDIDVRHVLPAVSVPTLVVHRVQERVTEVGHARYLARHIPAAKLVELPGEDHAPWLGDTDAVLDEVEEFLTGERTVQEPQRILATVMFIDIVASTARAATLGDRAWRELLEAFQLRVRELLGRFRGTEIDTAGDGFFASFDGPARGIRCAHAIREAVQRLDIQIRVGLHSGECEVAGEKLSGIAVHIGARVMAQAGADEVLVSSTVKDLVAGSGIAFEDRGAHALKGVPGDWRLFRALPD